MAWIHFVSNPVRSGAGDNKNETKAYMIAPLTTRIWRAVLDMGLRKKVAAIFIGMLIVSGLNLGIIHRMLQDFNGVAATATVAGKMRMLGQKLAYEALAFSEGLSGSYEALEHDIIDFEAAYLVLRSGGTTFDEFLRPLGARHDTSLNAVWLAWRQYRNHLRQLLGAAQTGDDLQLLQELQLGLSDVSADLLARTDELIARLVSESQDTQEKALSSLYLLLVLNAVILLLA